MAYLLGLDVGTTGAKALLITLNGEVVASATSEYPMFTPKPLWAEQNPEDWWQATQTSFRRIISESGVKPAEVTGVGLTGQMHGLVLLDKSGQVLHPCIMWNDQRTAPQCEAITSKIGLAKLLKFTANQVLPGFTAPKVVWVRENEPGIYDKAAQILLPKDYIRYRLTGEYATEVSDASGTSLLDVASRKWSNSMLSQLDIPKEWLPPVYESAEITGHITEDAAKATGLVVGTPVVGGGGDQAAGAVGSGIVKTGVVSITVGTSGVVFAHSPKLIVEPEGRLHSFCHAVPDAWHVMGVTLAAGGSLRWFRDTLAQKEIEQAKMKKVDPYELMMAQADKSPAGCEGLIFLPYLSGERTPYPDPSARGVFFGLTLRHTKADMTRAVLEGVAFSLLDCLEMIQTMGLSLSEVFVSGGGARSELWRKIIASILDTEVQTLSSIEGAPYGAALLAGVGTGKYSHIAEACEQAIKISTRTPPEPDWVDSYRSTYAIYRDMYKSFKPTFDRLA